MSPVTQLLRYYGKYYIDATLLRNTDTPDAIYCRRWSFQKKINYADGVNDEHYPSNDYQGNLTVKLLL